MPSRPSSLPPFSALPLNKDDPPFSAWGLYGKDDQLGFMNRQTDDVVAEAAKEIKTGVRFIVPPGSRSSLSGRTFISTGLVNMLIMTPGYL
jgi:hypothetical protein